MRTQAVLFDIGNVLITWQPERYYDRVYGVDRRKALFADVDLHWMNERLDRGEGFKDVIYETAEAYPEWRQEIRDWHDKWPLLAGPPIDHSIRLLRALRAKGTPVFALSNFGVESYAFAKSHIAVLNEFDVEYISGRLQVTKPDPRIYQIVEDLSGIAPSALLFADDRADNIAAAAARGWQTHLFKDPKGWAACLVDAGLLTVDEAA